jgi:hypothetical protein
MNDIKNSLQRDFGRGKLYVQKYSPEILLGVGLTGMVATVVMASKATLGANAILDETKKRLAVVNDVVEQAKVINPDAYSHEDEMKAKAIVYAQTGLQFTKLYGPAISVGVLSIAAILASHGVMAKRQVALVGAYNLLAEGYKQYRQRVVDELGEDVDRNYHLGLKEETRTETEIDEEGKKTKVKKTSKVPYDHEMKSIYSRFFDESNPMFRSDRTLNKAFLQAQQNYMNDILIIRGHVFLNEVYEALGFPHTKEGAIVGWVLKSPKEMKKEERDGYIDFGMYDVENDPGREFVNGTNPTILLDFNVDGIVFNQI